VLANDTSLKQGGALAIPKTRGAAGNGDFVAPTSDEKVNIQ